MTIVILLALQPDFGQASLVLFSWLPSPYRLSRRRHRRGRRTTAVVLPLPCSGGEPASEEPMHDVEAGRSRGGVE